MSTDNSPDTTVLLRALVALQIAERSDRLDTATPRPTEAVLADAGLGLSEIASLTGRKYESVKTTVRRARELKSARPKKKDSKRG